MSYCPKCGEEVGEGAEFCSNCGKNLSQDSVESDSKIGLPSISFPNKEKATLLVALLVIAVSAFSLMNERSTINDSSELKEISSNSLIMEKMEWNAYGDDRVELPIYEDQGSLVGRGNLVVETKQDEINAKVYAGNTIVTGSSIDNAESLYDKGKNTIQLYDVPIDSIGSQIRLEVCFSRKDSFSRSSQGVHCKDQMFRVPEPQIEVEPDPVEASISLPENGEKTVDTEITVRNRGEIPVRINRELEKDYDEFFFQDYTGSIAGWKELPERISQYHSEDEEGIITSIVLGSEEEASFNLRTVARSSNDPGYYSATGYIYSYASQGLEDAKFKKKFDITTEFNE